MSVQLMAYVEPFPISVPDRDLSTSARGSTRVRLREPDVDASQGLELDRLQTLLEAWRQHDWRALEKRWNAIPPGLGSANGAANQAGIPDVPRGRGPT
jgi:Epoxide hydrolase N terminus